MLKRLYQCGRLIKWAKLFLACLMSQVPNKTNMPYSFFSVDVVCPKNEVYVKLLEEVWCKPQTCDDLDVTGCVGVDDPAEWRPGCACADGFLRDRSGICVPISKCKRFDETTFTTVVMSCESPNEEYSSCGSLCEPDCHNYGSPSGCGLPCVAGCFCKQGYVRYRGSCITPESCPTKQQNACDGDVNAEYAVCKRSCEANCHNLWRIGPCKKGKHCKGTRCECESGCQCKIGFVKGPDGNCIPPGDCPHFQCPAGEEFDGCGSACTATCESPHVECDNAECVPGCACAEGMVRDMYGSCVRIEDCYKTFSPYYGTIGFKSTRAAAYDLSEAGPTFKNEDDYATPGLISARPTSNQNQNSAAAGLISTRPTSYYNDMTPGLISTRPTTNYNGMTPGLISIESITKKDDEEIQDQITESSSTISCGPDEEYSTCGTACPKTCENYDQQTGCGLACAQGCFCRIGLVRSMNGTCIHPIYCPESIDTQNDNIPEAITGILAKNEERISAEKVIEDFLCGEGEVFSECVVKCPPKTCAALNKMYRCLAEECSSGCTCKMSYLRDDNGRCVPSSQCPERKQTYDEIRSMIEENTRRTGTELYRVDD